MSLRPRYGDVGCDSCRFIDHFVGDDWYLCTGAPVAHLIARHSSAPHDLTVRSLAVPPTVGTWHRAFKLAKQRGLLP